MKKLLLTTVLLGALTASYAEYPDKKIEVITHSGAGGGTDLTARMMSKMAEPIFGQPMIIINKRGGGGSLSLDYLQSRPADGYAILTYTSGQAGEIAKGKTSVKLKNLIPIARATDDPQILMVKCNRFKNAHEFVEKQKKSSMTYGTTHLGGIDDVSAFAFTTKGKMQIAKVIPFDSAAEVATQLVAGGVDVGVLNLGEAKPQIDAGKVCPIVVLADQRMQAIPETVIAQEIDIPVSLSTVRGFVIKSGTPKEVVDKIEQSLLKAMETKEFVSFLEKMGLDASSIAGAETWSKQLKNIDKEMQNSLKQLGFIH